MLGEFCCQIVNMSITASDMGLIIMAADSCQRWLI